jgi:hypothetical protein
MKDVRLDLCHILLWSNKLDTYIFFAAGVTRSGVVRDGDVIHEDVQSGGEALVLYL